MAAKHIETAKREGAKAGFKAWKMNLKRSGIPQVQERYAELLEQGDVQAQFRYYCAQYGDQFGLTPARKSQGRTATPAASSSTPTTEDLFAKFQEFLGALGTQATEVDEDADLDEIDEDAELDAIEEPVTVTTTATATRPATRRAAAPNADPFAPREPNAHATNGRLWKLNELGLLRVAKNPGDAITNGQAHTILKAQLS